MDKEERLKGDLDEYGREIEKRPGTFKNSEFERILRRNGCTRDADTMERSLVNE